jgi:hypothetical protein
LLFYKPPCSKANLYPGFTRFRGILSLEIYVKFCVFWYLSWGGLKTKFLDPSQKIFIKNQLTLMYNKGYKKSLIIYCTVLNRYYKLLGILDITFALFDPICLDTTNCRISWIQPFHCQVLFHKSFLFRYNKTAGYPGYNLSLFDPVP